MIIFFFHVVNQQIVAALYGFKFIISLFYDIIVHLYLYCYVFPVDLVNLRIVATVSVVRFIMSYV